MKSFKICHLVATTEGANWMFEQLRELRNRYGFSVTAVISGNSGGLVDKLTAEKIPFYVFDFRLKNFWRIPQKIVSLIRLFRRERFDVVQTHLFYSMIIGRLAAWLADVPVRLSMIAGPSHLEAYNTHCLDLYTCWMDSALIASCEYTRTLYKRAGVKDSQLVLIYYGYDANKFDPDKISPAPIREEFGWPHDTPVIAMVAHFYPRFKSSLWIPSILWGRTYKNHECLIKAMPKVLTEFPEVKCLLVGQGWEEGGEKNMFEMQQLVRSLNLEKSVVFAGFRSDMPNIFSAVDVSVKSSLNENLGGTTESLLMECPTVATRVGGMTDSIKDGKTGILVRIDDSDDLAQGILKLLRNPTWARTLGREGRQFMLERFTLTRTVADLNDLYRSQILKKSERGGYHLYSSFWRVLVVIPLFVYLVLHLILTDIYWRFGQLFRMHNSLKVK